MISFYELIDVFAEVNNISKEETLHLFYRGTISAHNLLEAWLENEGIFGYTDQLIKVIKTLSFHFKKEGFADPWELNV